MFGLSVWIGLGEVRMECAWIGIGELIAGSLGLLCSPPVHVCVCVCMYVCVV